jgi:hypothetical protein
MYETNDLTVFYGGSALVPNDGALFESLLLEKLLAGSVVLGPRLFATEHPDAIGALRQGRKFLGIDFNAFQGGIIRLILQNHHDFADPPFFALGRDHFTDNVADLEFFLLLLLF